MATGPVPPRATTLAAGRPYPLGAALLPDGINFAVFSEHATAIEVCLYDAAGQQELARFALPACTHGIWHGFLPGARAGTVYGLRAYGPYDPGAGHRFNPAKLLIDPYARELLGPLHSVHAMRGALADDDSAATSPPHPEDSGPVTAKARVVEDAFDWGDEPRPDTPLAQSVIYEAHVRGISMLRSDLDPAIRGTFAALADERFIDHLLRLGVTALELLPIHPVLHDRFLLEAGLCNYWGYNNINYFAVDPRYLSSGSPDEMRRAVDRLHRAGLEVILDVVYNHTAEGDARGPTAAFRGLDNASYYRLLPGDASRYVNDTGCGNTLNIAHPRVLQMVLDSLRYFATSFHIDGYRFDLATTLARDPDRFDARGGFLDALMQDPVLSRLKLIAEPWDVGYDGYQVGKFPAGFSEWNDKFRDSTRRFWRGDPGQRGEFAARLSGSPDLFEHDKRRPDASINFVTAHDGFTLTDLVSYAARHNLANGENNRDGADNNLSSNWGAPDGADDAAVAALRERVKRAMLTTLFFAQGVPMLLGGDEFGRTQLGNNNAYCQDSPLSWLDWTLAEHPRGAALTRFVSRLADLRRELSPPLSSTAFLHGEWVRQGLRNTDWFDANGDIVTGESWNDPGISTLALRRVAADGEAGALVGLLLLMNGGADVARFVLPCDSFAWRLRLNSDSADGGEEEHPQGEVTVPAHTAMVLSARAEPG